MIMSKTTDSVIDEIHQVRMQISARFNGNIAEIAKDAAYRQSVSGRTIWKSKTPDKAIPN